jgi:glutamate racemase
VEVVEQVGEGIVTLIEAGKLNSPEMSSLLEGYLLPMLEKGIDHLVLGCTHYPLLIPQISALIGHKISILDSGEAVARQTKNILIQENLINTSSIPGYQKFYSNSDPKFFQQILDSFNKGYIAQQIDF